MQEVSQSATTENDQIKQVDASLHQSPGGDSKEAEVRKHVHFVNNSYIPARELFC